MDARIGVGARHVSAGVTGRMRGSASVSVMLAGRKTSGRRKHEAGDSDGQRQFA
jgi:hypothetical protein